MLSPSLVRTPCPFPAPRRARLISQICISAQQRLATERRRDTDEIQTRWKGAERGKGSLAGATRARREERCHPSSHNGAPGEDLGAQLAVLFAFCLLLLSFPVCSLVSPCQFTRLGDQLSLVDPNLRQQLRKRSRNPSGRRSTSGISFHPSRQGLRRPHQQEVSCTALSPSTFSASSCSGPV